MTGYVLACRFPVVDATVPLADLYVEADRQARVMAAGRGVRLVGKPRRRVVDTPDGPELLTSQQVERIDVGGSWGHAVEATLVANRGGVLAPSGPDVCSTGGCQGRVWARGLCNACYKRSLSRKRG